MRATEFIAEAKLSIANQIHNDVKKHGGNHNEYFVRLTDTDKLGFSAKQGFGQTPDVNDPNFDVDYIGKGAGRRALWFYPLTTYLKTRNLYASEQPYVWLVKLKPNAWLQTVTRKSPKELQQAPAGKERVGILRMSNPPAAIFFTHGYDVVGKYYDYASKHKRHGQVKGAPEPTFFQSIRDKFSEAEEGTPHAKEIADTLKKAGYKQLGQGADSTVWTDQTQNIVKILMPESEGTIHADTFKKFVKFCVDHSDLECVPKFLNINNKAVNKFKVLDKDYYMVAMEKLSPIKKNSFEEGMVWQLSDYAMKNIPWGKVKEELSYPDAWLNDNDIGNEETMSDRVYNMSDEENTSYKTLFNVMTFLYLKGQINKFGWDLHTENVMQRKDGTLVIIDPWFEIYNNVVNEINNGYRWNDDKLYRHLV